MTSHAATVEVPAHDLHRLLLSFRAALESGKFPPGTWMHAVDYDWSFERLADILDQYRAANGWHLDPRTRCQRTAVYQWPDASAPARWVSVRGGSHGGRARHLTAGTHAADPGRDGLTQRALCGFRFTVADVVKKPSAVYRPCEVCERERQLQGVAVEEPVSR